MQWPQVTDVLRPREVVGTTPKNLVYVSFAAPQALKRSSSFVSRFGTSELVPFPILDASLNETC